MRRSCLAGVLVLVATLVSAVLLVGMSARASYLPPEVARAITRAASTAVASAPTAALPLSMTAALVVRVVDGDTIDVKLDDGDVKRLRYIGVDSPERNQSECYYRVSSDYNSKLVLNRQVWLERDVSEFDRYGRLLRYVYLPDGRMVNEEMVKAGYAQVTTYPPDVRYKDRFLLAQQEARAKSLGLWGVCTLPAMPTAQPAAPKRSATVQVGCPAGCSIPPVGCEVKGNISAKGEKIYHVPGQEYYTRTLIDPDKGERWFCTEAEAVANGWRKSMR